MKAVKVVLSDDELALIGRRDLATYVREAVIQRLERETAVPNTEETK